MMSTITTTDRDRLFAAEDAEREHQSTCDACILGDPCEEYEELRETARELSRKVRRLR